MIVYPLSQGSVASEHQCQDVTSAGLVGVLLSRTLEPANFERASQRVDLECPDRAGDAGGDWRDADHVSGSLCVVYRTRGHWSANIAKCVSTTKSITSSVADTLKRSQNQSTAMSADAMVSNRKSCRSCSVWGLERSVFVMMTL